MENNELNILDTAIKDARFNTRSTVRVLNISLDKKKAIVCLNKDGIIATGACEELYMTRLTPIIKEDKDVCEKCGLKHTDLMTCNDAAFDQAYEEYENHHQRY